MEWDPRIGYPEQHLVNKIERCDEGDMWEMISRTTSQFDRKFFKFAFFVKGDSLRKLKGIMGGEEYQRIIEMRALNHLISLAQKDSNETQKPANAPDSPLDMVTVPIEKDGKNKTFCHYYNNGNCCTVAKSCIFRHEKSKVCKQALNCSRRLCQFRHRTARSPVALIIKREDQKLPESRILSAEVITEEDQSFNCTVGIYCATVIV